MCLQKELLCSLMLVLGLFAGAQSSPSNTKDITETLQLARLGDNPYYLGVAKVNWYKALQYCRYHDMNLVSISSQEEYTKLLKHIKDAGYWQERFWTSGSDQAEEGKFVWMGNGHPLTFSDWRAEEPNNYKGSENCIELWNRNNEGLKFNDAPCSFELYFICE